MTTTAIRTSEIAAAAERLNLAMATGDPAICDNDHEHATAAIQSLKLFTVEAGKLDFDGEINWKHLSEDLTLVDALERIEECRTYAICNLVYAGTIVKGN